MRNRILLFVLSQLGCLFLLVATALISFNQVAAVSALLGGLVVIGPSAYFAYHYFSVTGASQSKHIVKRFYRGEALKLIIVGLLTAMCASLGVNLMWFLLGFVLMQLMAWSLPWFFRGPVWRML